MKEVWQRRRVRFAAIGAAAALVVAVLASGGLAALTSAVSSSGPAALAHQYQYPPGKVTICHRTHSKKNPWVKIRVSQRALKAHLRHGDFIVTPDRPCPPKAKKAKKAKKAAKKAKRAKQAKNQAAKQKQKSKR
jgi:hypothetical protein